MPVTDQAAHPLVLVPTQAALRAETEAGARPLQALNRAYVAALQMVGLTPILFPTRSRLPSDLSFIDGLLLPGGPDIDPLRYGQDLDPSTVPDTESDQLEFALLDWALSAGVPVLAICRGLQVLNVGLGGTLVQDLPQHCPRPEAEGPVARDVPAHPVRVDPASRLGQLVEGETIAVNSLHHQGIERLAPSLRASAWAPDGLIEAVELPGDQFVLGVQYHPEELVGHDRAAREIFEGYAAACRKEKVPAQRPVLAAAAPSSAG
ncbi:MAG TPA: gamma-glutamyl-gamma-aminobutyrate hydrolase family protein [Candidatus Dormibacteraeota bacterium]